MALVSNFRRVEGRLHGTFRQPARGENPERIVRVFSAHRQEEIATAAAMFTEKWGPELGVDAASLSALVRRFPEGLVVAVNDSTQEMLGAMQVIRKRVSAEDPVELNVTLPKLTGEQGEKYYSAHEQDGNGFVCHSVASTSGVPLFIGKFVLQMAREMHPYEDLWVGPYSRPVGFSHSGRNGDILGYLRERKDPVIHRMHETIFGARLRFVVQGGRPGDSMAGEYAAVMQFVPQLEGEHEYRILVPKE